MLGEIRHWARILFDLHVAVLGDREQHVEHLRGEDVIRRVEEQNLDVRPPALRSLFSCARLGPDAVGLVEGVHPLGRESVRGARGDLVAAGMGGDYTQGSRLQDRLKKIVANKYKFLDPAKAERPLGRFIYLHMVTF